MSRRSKSHHYVPKVLQKNFISEDRSKHVWYSKKTKEEFCAPYLKHIDKAFCERNRNTITDPNGEYSDTFEREYGKIDNFLGQILGPIDQSLKSDKTEALISWLNGKVRSDLRKTVIWMSRRQPQFALKSDEEIGRVWAGLVESSDPKKQSEMKTVLENPSKLKEFGRKERLQHELTIPSNIASDLNDRVVCLAIAPTNHSFILSSRMVYRIGSDAKWCMPLFPGYALVLCRGPMNQIPLTLVVDPEFVQGFNEVAARESNEIASHSRKLIESITGKKAINHFG